jgi:hypothetical protein
MRLLERNSAGQLSPAKIFVGNNIPEYAILSHTWGADTEEVTYGDLIDSTGKSKADYSKIRVCEERAKRDGLQYFWVDTCSTYKSNSVDPQEAMNSMFRWYQNMTNAMSIYRMFRQGSGKQAIGSLSILGNLLFGQLDGLLGDGPFKSFLPQVQVRLSSSLKRETA